MGGVIGRPQPVAGAGLGLLVSLARRLPLVSKLERHERLSEQRAACLRQMPALLDVLGLGLSSGLSFDASLELYCDRYDNELSHAFRAALVSWRLGMASRQEALWSLADETGVSAVRSFATTVTQALEFGSPLAEALERQSQEIRDERRSQVEEAIEKVPVKMLVPLGTLIVPAMLLSILGPLVGSSLAVG
ncbi:type II secretion system F family protein [Parafannyhessea umbonata]|uniref:type II secretion system F family protein n=1 Tax=Parafannyhessea umbonata TaxID=604330 RepID=UPI0021483FF5|nr:type II secretion system F family protein [Parafannyhessea umbonata]